MPPTQQIIFTTVIPLLSLVGIPWFAIYLWRRLRAWARRKGAEALVAQEEAVERARAARRRT